MSSARHIQPAPPPAQGLPATAPEPRNQVGFEVMFGAVLALKIVVALAWLVAGQLLGLSVIARPAAVAVKPAEKLPVLSGAAGLVGRPAGFIIPVVPESSVCRAKPQLGFRFGLQEAWAQDEKSPARSSPPPAAMPPPPAVSRPNPSPASRPPLDGSEAWPASGERDLNKREMALKARESALNTLAEDLNRKLADLEAAKVEMETLVRRNEALLAEQKRLKDEQAAQEEELKSARIEHLVTAYRSMKPEQAANLVNSMDDEIAVAILGAMPGRNAGLILAFVNPEKAARLTKSISERRLDPTLLLNQADNVAAQPPPQ